MSGARPPALPGEPERRPGVPVRPGGRSRRPHHQRHRRHRLFDQLFGALGPPVILKGLITGSSLMAGAFFAKRFVLRLDAQAFRHVMDALLLISGLIMLYNAATASGE